jgi:hypothetical protein
MGTFADELAAAACQGMKKRARLEEFERNQTQVVLEREWKRIKSKVVDEAEGHGSTFFRMHYDASKNQEFRPDANHILERMPGDLQDLRTAKGCDVRVDPGDLQETWEICISVAGLAYALMDKELKEIKEQNNEEDEAVKEEEVKKEE